MIPEGIYDATIEDARLEEASDGDDLVLAFDFTILEEQATAKHRTTGDYAHITKDVAKHLELEWPYGLARIARTIGRAVRVKVKHKVGNKGNTFVNAYIYTGAGQGKPANPAKIQGKLDFLAGKDDIVPF